MNTHTNENTVTTSDGRTFTLPPRTELLAILTELRGKIGDDYRASDDPEDDQPGMCVTVGASPDGSWHYQTGDNSYSGGAYLHAYWGVGYLYRDSNPEDVADGIIDEIADGMLANAE